MNEKIIVHGMILSSSPIGEADRRVVILTGERGKITAFARGARRQGSSIAAATRPFAYGEITLFEGRSSYVLDAFSGVNYFDKVVTDLENSFYASYFVEFASYYTREGLEARETIRLLYAAFLALEKGVISRELIKAIFELRLMAINGEYSEGVFVGRAKSIGNANTNSASGEEISSGAILPATTTAWQHVTTQPLEKLFSFNLEEEPKRQFISAVESLRDYFIEYKFKSLEMINLSKM